jgi:hypothetical protein
MKLGRMVGVLTVLAMVALVAVRATNALSAPAVSAPKLQAVHVQVVPADRYCTFGTGDLMRCQSSSHHSRFHLGGPHNQWLVIFSLVAPRSTAGRTYYFFTAHAPGRCLNASQFGTSPPVRKGQRVVNWATFDKDCPSLGQHGTISLITDRTQSLFPIKRVGRLVARFKFTIP